MTQPLMERPKDRKSWAAGVALSIIAAGALLSVPLQVAVFRNIEGASQADVDRNARLIEQVRRLEQASVKDVEQHRRFNQADHNCIVALALMLADPERDRTVKPVLPSECEHAPAIDAVQPSTPSR